MPMQIAPTQNQHETSASYKSGGSQYRILRVSLQIIVLVLVTILFLLIVLPFFSQSVPEIFTDRCQSYLASVVALRVLIFFEVGFIYALLISLLLGNHRAMITGVGIAALASVYQVMQWIYQPSIFILISEWDAIPGVDCLSGMPTYQLFLSIVALTLPILISGFLSLKLGGFVQYLIQQILAPTRS